MSKTVVITTSFPLNDEDYSGLFVLNHLKLISDFSVVIAPHKKGSLNFEKKKNIEIYRIKYFSEDLELLFYHNGVIENLKKKPYLIVLSLPWFVLSFLRALSLIKEKDILITHWIFPTGLSGAFIKMFKKKITHISVVHSAGITILRKYNLKFIAKLIYRYSDRLHFVNTEHLKWFENLIDGKIDFDKLILKPMPVEIPEFNKNYESKGYIVYLGRLVKIKGLNLMLEELKNITKRKVLIIGDGELKKNLSKKYDFADFKGKKNGNEKYKLLIESKIMIVPSIVDGKRQEGFPTVILEGALTKNILIISKYIKGIDYVFRDKINCLYYDPFKKGDLKSKIDYIEKNEKKIKKMVELSYNTVLDIIESYKFDYF